MKFCPYQETITNFETNQEHVMCQYYPDKRCPYSKKEKALRKCEQFKLMKEKTDEI